MLFLFWSCAVLRPSRHLPDKATHLADDLARRDAQIRSLQTPAIMDYNGPGGRIKAREEIAIRRPECLRVEAMSPLGTAVIVAVSGDKLGVFDASSNTLMHGPSNQATLDRFARIPMKPQEAVRLLLALPPDISSPPSSYREQNGAAILTYLLGDGGSAELEVDSTGRLTAVRQLERGGRVDYEVHYGDYEAVGAVAFPHTIDMSFPASGTSLRLRYEKPIIDGDIPDSRFVLSPGPATRQINLGMDSGHGVADG